MSVLVQAPNWMSFSSYPTNSSGFVKARNDVELSRDMLISVLTHFSSLISNEFNGTPVRLVCHGGAVMLLHRDLNRLAQQRAALNAGCINGIPLRTTTRDVDYISRSFVTEYTARGFPDAGERLQRCIRATAAHFRIGADWMNSDADVALPMAGDLTTGKPYDPIYQASIQPNNIHVHTIFTSPNRVLSLIAVAPFWSMALKLVRYNARDAGDIVLLLQNGTATRGVQWTNQLAEDWILTACWPMGYSNYPPEKIQETRNRIAHAVSCLNAPPSDSRTLPASTSSGQPVVRASTWPSAQFSSPPASHTTTAGWAGPGTLVWASAPASPAPLGWPGPAASSSISLSLQHRTSITGPVPAPSPSISLSGRQQSHTSLSAEAFDRSVGALLESPTYPTNLPVDAEYYNMKSRASGERNKGPWKILKTEKKKPKKASNAGKTKGVMQWRGPDDSDDDYDTEPYSDDDDQGSWGSSGDSWTLVDSQRSSPKLYPPRPIRVDTPPIDFNEFSVLQRPTQKQYTYP